jgi:hypothetical protein
MKTYTYEETIRFTVEVTANTRTEAKDKAIDFMDDLLDRAAKVKNAPHIKNWDMNTTDYEMSGEPTEE